MRRPAQRATQLTPVRTCQIRTAASRCRKRLADIDHLQLDDVRIEDGTLRFTDERSGKTQEVKAINVNLALKSLQAPLTINGDLAWQGEKIDFNAKLTSAKAILEEKPARLVFARPEPAHQFEL